MSKRFLLLLTLIAAIACGCVTPTKTEVTPAATAPSTGGADQAFKAIHDKYVVEFLRRNPTVNTYLGGAGLDASLRDVDGSLRDHTPAAIDAEDTWLAETQKAIESVDPNSLSAPRRIDREVALAQIRFLLHQHRERRYQERALDTYTDEPFRAIDWQLQGMTQTGEKSYGTPEEWALITKRLGSIPRYLSVAQEQLAAGIKSGNTPDQRMLRRNGIETAEANAKYFEQTLPALAAERLAASSQRDQLLAQVRDAARQASAAYIGLRDFVKRSFFNEMYSGKFELTPKPEFSADRYASGEDEYNRALKNNLRITDKTAAQLYDESWPVVERTRNEMIDLARKIGAQRGITLPADGAAAVRAVFDELSKDYPKSDAEMVNWYREASFRLVDYARKTGIFDVPVDYKLDVVETPPPLQASIDGAAYYPAPPFKNSGVGRFYVTPTNNDTAALKSNNRASLADLAAHEGFPGHDWHYKVLTQFRDQIAPVRWLTPGAVEDSSSMWQDSVASEGWGLYAEALMAEPQPGAPEGFYTPEERLYQLQGKLYRDLRVRIDIGIHTGRVKYDEAVNLFSEVVDFLPGTCGSDAAAKNSEAKQASCKSAERAIFRYSKWPTQAITYRLGKEQIFALRDEAARIAGDKFSPKAFHLLFMKQGTIPAGYFREELLREIREGK
ncbi:MAG: DUF885 domain-containing protein [Acidobacteriota bacterium]|nr:DUF885 domain-containing protein [Acidobacteriota bacterium]